jgi:hypothetical protein
MIVVFIESVFQQCMLAEIITCRSQRYVRPLEYGCCLLFHVLNNFKETDTHTHTSYLLLYLCVFKSLWLWSIISQNSKEGKQFISHHCWRSYRYQESCLVFVFSWLNCHSFTITCSFFFMLLNRFEISLMFSEVFNFRVDILTKKTLLASQVPFIHSSLSFKTELSYIFFFFFFFEKLFVDFVIDFLKDFHFVSCFEWTVSIHFFSDPFVKISKKLPDGSYTLVHRTPVIKNVQQHNTTQQPNSQKFYTINTKSSILFVSVLVFRLCIQCGLLSKFHWRIWLEVI